MLDKFKLDGKVAIVTGVSTGLGKGMAIGLAQAGADVVGIGQSDMTETKKEIESFGRKFYQFKCNLVDGTVEELKELVKNIVAETKTVDILVNNAGIIRREDSIKFSEKDWDDVMNINVKNMFFLSQAFANVLIDQKKGGKIINIASMLSFQGGIRVPSYTASKSAVKGVTMTMANEWGQYGINVNAIAPGYMDTNNTKALREDPERNKAILDRIPMGRWGDPSDLAGACVFLAGDNSNYISGYTIAVDGGWLSR